MILMAFAAAAGTMVAIPFAPPTAPMRYEVLQTRDSRSGKVHFNFGRTVRFIRVEGGWRMEMTLTDYKTDATGNSLAVVDAGVGALKGVTFAFSINDAGAFTGMIDGDKALAIMSASYQKVLKTVEADPGTTPERLAGVRMIIAAVEKQPRDAQLQHLQDDARYLSDHAGLNAPLGKPANFAQTPAAGAQITGSETLASADAGVARFILDSHSEPNPDVILSVSEHIETSVSTTTGLLIESTRTRTTTGPGNASQTLEETRKLAPLDS